MSLEIKKVKYSIFGPYEPLEATPGNVSKIYEILGPEQYLPDLFKIIEIQQPDNTIKQINRMQFVNNQTSSKIAILPERLDIETNMGMAPDLVFRYLNQIIELFDLKINRIALNTNAVWDNPSEEDIKIITKKLISKEAYPYTDSLIEWSSRNVARKMCSGIGEEINIGQNIQSTAGLVNGKVQTTQIRVDTDINTLGENSAERFNSRDCKEFFKDASKWNQNLLDNLKGCMKNANISEQ